MYYYNYVVMSNKLHDTRLIEVGYQIVVVNMTKYKT
jgi:hypothetical protein